MLTLITFFLAKYAFLCVLTMLRIKAENDELASDDDGGGGSGRRRLPVAAPGARSPATADDPFVPFFTLHSSVALTSFQDAKAEQQTGGNSSSGEQRDDDKSVAADEDGVFPFVRANSDRQNRAAGASTPFSWAFLNRPSDASALAALRVDNAASSLPTVAQKDKSTLAAFAAAVDDRVTIRVAAGYPQLTHVPTLVLKSKSNAAASASSSASQRSTAHSVVISSPALSGVQNVRGGRLPALKHAESVGNSDFALGDSARGNALVGNGTRQPAVAAVAGALPAQSSDGVLELTGPTGASTAPAAAANTASGLSGGQSASAATSAGAAVTTTVQGSGIISLYANTLAQATGIKVSSKSRNAAAGRNSLMQADANAVSQQSPPSRPALLDTGAVDAADLLGSSGSDASRTSVASAAAASTATSSSLSPVSALDSTRMARRGANIVAAEV